MWHTEAAAVFEQKKKKDASEFNLKFCCCCFSWFRFIVSERLSQVVTFFWWRRKGVGQNKAFDLVILLAFKTQKPQLIFKTACCLKNSLLSNEDIQELIPLQMKA